MLNIHIESSGLSYYDGWSEVEIYNNNYYICSCWFHKNNTINIMLHPAFETNVEFDKNAIHKVIETILKTKSKIRIISNDI